MNLLKSIIIILLFGAIFSSCNNHQSKLSQDNIDEINALVDDRLKMATVSNGDFDYGITLDPHHPDLYMDKLQYNTSNQTYYAQIALGQYQTITNIDFPSTNTLNITVAGNYTTGETISVIYVPIGTFPAPSDVGNVVVVLTIQKGNKIRTATCSTSNAGHTLDPK